MLEVQQTHLSIQNQCKGVWQGCGFGCNYADVFSGLDYSTPWRGRYEDARRALEETLHVTHPVMLAILNLWDKYKDRIYKENKTDVLVDLSGVR